MAKRKLVVVGMILVLLYIMNTVCMVEAKEIKTGKTPMDTRSYREEINNLLEEFGMYHTGMTMTHTIEHNRYTYEIEIHHNKIEQLSSAQLEDIRKSCSEVFAQICDDEIHVLLR